MNLPALILDSISVGFWASFMVATIVALPLYIALKRLKSQQTVSQYAPSTHQVKQGTPTMGGLVFLAGFLVAAWLLRWTELQPISLAALVLFVAFAAIGLLDDFIVPKWIKGKRGLGWKQKIVLQAAAAGVAMYLHSGTAGDFRWFAAVFVILFVANAYNFVDGLDGLAGSVLLIYGGGLMVLAFAGVEVPEAAVLCGALMGAAIPFLALNAPPAKWFMGDVGALPIGATLGLAVVLVLSPLGHEMQPITAHGIPAVEASWLQSLKMLWRPEMLAPMLVLNLVLIVELVPVPIQILWVKLFKKRLFPYTPIHHAFEKVGWPESRVVWSFVLAQLVLSLLAVSMLIARPSDASASSAISRQLR